MEIADENRNREIRNKGIITAVVAREASKRILGGSVLYGLKQIDKAVNVVQQQDKFQLKQAINTAMKQSGLKQKGFEIAYLKEAPKPKFSDVLKKIKNDLSNKDKTPILKRVLQSVNSGFKYEEGENEIVNRYTKFRLNIYNKNPLYKIKPFSEIKEELAKYRTNKILSKIKAGENACINNSYKKIIMPEKKLHTAIFHEIGHNINLRSPFIRQMNKMTKYMHKVPLAILTLALLNKQTEKSEQNSNQNTLQKAHNGLKKYAGLLAGLSVLPKLINEGMASINGQKLAKSLMAQNKLSKELYKKIILTNVMGFSSYAAGAMVTGGTVYAAIKLKDKIQQHYENKNK